ncbi:MAG TPA: hypothetical protein VNU68_23365 [Verrucomicrobiae bacterium]|jgi:hypothetical protein|nr:hypothetical protein [Verrucomicrobiae bacterium]
MMFSEQNGVSAVAVRSGAPASAHVARAPGAGLRILALGWTALALLAAGCRREAIAVYTVPKDKARPSAMAQSSPRVQPQPMLSWVLPADWKQKAAGQLNVATFSISGAGGEQAEVTITPLTNLSGRDVEIVNMWRERVGLDPLSREQVETQFEPVTVAGESGRMFQIDGTTKLGKEQNAAARIVTVVVHRPDASWFYKLAGDASLVEEQKPAFLQFLRTLRIQESSETESADGSAKPSFNWQMPAHWTEMPAGQMQVAKFAVPDRGTGKAEVSVSRFPTDTGGTLANVNRWRKQLGLGEVQENELASIVSVLDPANPEARLVDLTHDDRRLLGAIVPRAGIYWFYKLVGDAKAVAPEREAFIQFARSTP